MKNMYYAWGDKNVLIKWILKGQGVKVWNGFSWFTRGYSKDCNERSNFKNAGIPSPDK